MDSPMTICSTCAADVPDGFRFCGACGAPLEVPARPRQVRKVVTALFCDVTGSTALGEQLDPEVLNGVMNRYFAVMRAIIERHGGPVEKFIGDAVMAVFGIPQVREDDALRAVRAAAEIREQLPAVAEEVGVALRFRTGVNTGPVLMGEGEILAIGDALNVAARLEQAAAPGEIVLGQETLRLVRDAVVVEALEPLELKGKTDPVRAFRLVVIDPVAPGYARHLDLPMVGRERELRLLADAWERTVDESRCHLFTVLGAAGVGKSRLVAELLARAGDRAVVLRGRCLHYGEGVTFWPLVEALMAAGEPAQAVLERLGAGGAAIPQELFWEVRRLLESLACERPLILHVDDLQWAQPMLLDLLDHVTDLSRGHPILVLCAARPELVDERASWGGGKLNATTVLLEPLDSASSERLLDQLGDGLDAAARARVIAVSEGNPLFLEEIVALARERGQISVPATIQALLAARLEQLAVQEREVLERGAVEGEVFHRLAIRELAGERQDADVQLLLAGLVRKELIRPHQATFRGDEAFRFRHLLIRDAAYEGLAKTDRAELHQRFACWLERVGAELAELDEIAGWHLEQALRYQHELGRPADPELARRAADHLHAAGSRASRRSDPPAACNLLDRALALAPAALGGRARIAVDLAEQLTLCGELDRANGLLSAVEHDPEVAAPASLVRLEWLTMARPHEAIEAIEAIEARLPKILEQLLEAGDGRGVAKAHTAAFQAHWIAGQATAASREARLAAEHARVAGDEGLRAAALGYYFATLVFGRAHASELSRELARVEGEQSGPYLAAAIKVGSAVLCRLEGRFTDASRLMRQEIEDLNALGLQTRAAAHHEGLAEIELAAGNFAEALAVLKEADTILAQQGERSHRSTIQAYLAETHERLDDHGAAQAAIDLCEQLSAPDDELNHAMIDGVRARLALSEGDAKAAEHWARSAAGRAMRTDLVVDQGHARLNLAHVLAALGRQGEATSEARAALDLYKLKGDRPGARRATGLLDRLRIDA
jgi:class 3 adenylate cyclase